MDDSRHAVEERERVERRQRKLVMRSFQLQMVMGLVFVSGIGLVLFLVLMLLPLYAESAHYLRVPLGVSSPFQNVDMYLFRGFSISVLASVALAFAMGIRLSHRVAGALYRLMRHLDRWSRGDLRDDVQLRGNDLIVPFGERMQSSLAALRRLARDDRAEGLRACRELEELAAKGGLAEEEARRIRDIAGRLSAIGSGYRLPEASGGEDRDSGG